MRTGFWGAAALAGGIALATLAQAADWQDGAPAEWAKVVAAAKAEGKVVVAGSPDMGKPFTDAFQRDTGIKLEYLGGNTRDLSSRAARELRTNQVTIDMMIGGASELPLINEGLATPLDNQLMLPTVTEGKYWADGKLRWVDKGKKYMLQGAEYVNGQPFINTAVVKPDAIKTWKDMLKPEFRGKISAQDPRQPGSGQAAAAYLAALFGMDFIKQLYVDQKVMMTGDARQVTEWAARGTYPIAIGGSPTDYETFKAAGIRTLIVGDMEDGPGTTVGGFSLIWQLKGNPHPNAARVFLNWYLSKPGQEAYIAAKGTPSMRTDIDTSALPAYLKPQPGKKYLETYQEEFYLGIRPGLTKHIQDSLGGN